MYWSCNLALPRLQSGESRCFWLILALVRKHPVVAALPPLPAQAGGSPFPSISARSCVGAEAPSRRRPCRPPPAQAGGSPFPRISARSCVGAEAPSGRRPCRPPPTKSRWLADGENRHLFLHWSGSSSRKAHGASRKPIPARSGSSCPRHKPQDARSRGAEAPHSPSPHASKPSPPLAPVLLGPADST